MSSSPTKPWSCKTVKIGPVEADQTVIESGLEAGEVVVVDGVDKLEPGKKVEARDRNSAKPKAPPQSAQDSPAGDGAEQGSR